MTNELNFDQLKKLWILNLVIKSKSLKKASVLARVSPSAISQSITALEKAYGKRLLLRDKGGVSATAEAVEILSVISPAFEVFSQLKLKGQTEIPKIAWLNFGTYESIAIDLLPGLVQELRENLPLVRLGLRISRSSNLLSMLRKGELCSVLIPEVDDLNRFYLKEVGEDNLGLYGSKKQFQLCPGLPLVNKIGWGTLAPGKDGIPRYMRRFLKQFDLPKPAIMSDSFEVLRAAAVAGSMVALLPARVAERFDDLVPLIDQNQLQISGRHKLLVVSQSSCDRKEADFVAEVARKLLRSRSYSI